MFLQIYFLLKPVELLALVGFFPLYIYMYILHLVHINVSNYCCHTVHYQALSHSTCSHFICCHSYCIFVLFCEVYSMLNSQIYQYSSLFGPNLVIFFVIMKKWSILSFVVFVLLEYFPVVFQYTTK